MDRLGPIHKNVIVILCCTSLIVLGLARAAAGSMGPDTPALRALNSWLTAFNSGDRKAYRAFLRNHYPSKVKDLDDDLQFRALTGGFALRKVENFSPSTVIALVQERTSDQFGRVTLKLDPTGAHHITNISIRAISRPPEFALPHMSETQLAAALREKLQENARSDRFSGAVIVAKNGKPIVAEAYGFADREHHIPNTLGTRFRIGSMNKMFTAVAILQFVQAGKVGLDDPLGKYLTDYPNKDVASKVTIRELLTHTGGTGDIFGPEFKTHRSQLRTLQDYVTLYGSRPLRFKPGSRWEYSNYGFILLGTIIEKVSRQSYYDYVRENVYKPAGMTSSDFAPETQAVANRSVGYTKMFAGHWQPNVTTLPYRGTSAGGGYSTVQDLLSFANALEANKLLNAQYTEMLTTGKVHTPGGGEYAFGFGDYMVNGTRCFGHGGGAPGMNGDLEICPRPGYVVAVLANLDPPAASRISDFVTNRLPKP